MGIFDLSSRILNKKLDNAAQAAAATLPRVDTGLPLNAQIGSLLELSRADFAILDGSLLTVPSAAQLPVVAVGRLRLDANKDLGLYRLYTQCGADRHGEGQSFLQILGNGDDIQDIVFYQHLLRQVPTTAEEQAPFLGEGFGLGQLQFDLADDLLSAAGLSDEKIDALLGDTDSLVYIRDTPVATEYVYPYIASETRLDDAIGEKGLKKKLHFMPYVRTLPDGNEERLLITFEVVSSVDGKSAPQVYVDYLVGLSLARQKVKVL